MNLGQKTARPPKPLAKSKDFLSVNPEAKEDYSTRLNFNLNKWSEAQRIWAEINLDALDENLKAVKKLLGNKKILLAIKADAYGHGAKEIAVHLDGRVDMFGVASLEEGINLRTNGNIISPILVLSPIPYSGIDALFEYNLTPSISEKEFSQILTQKAKKRKKPMKVHIEVDTGMGRTGFSLGEATETITQINTGSYLEVEGVFTHFPAADNDFPFTRQQIEKYVRLTDSLIKSGVKPIIRHVANSAGFLNFAESYFDMIRPGLIIYGISPNQASHQIASLKPVMSLRTRIVNLRKIPKGNSISYERTYVTQRASMIAVITTGYGDGYPWSLSNNAEVLVAGQRAKVVGNVCMDLTMIDVTDIQKVKIGDTVTLIGNNGSETITVNELAGWAKTIPYEVITRISPRVPRVFIKEEKVQRVRDLLHL